MKSKFLSKPAGAEVVTGQKTHDVPATQHYTEERVTTTTEAKTSSGITASIQAKADRLAEIQRTLTDIGAVQLQTEFDEIKKDLAEEIKDITVDKAINIPTANGGVVTFTAPKSSLVIVDKEGVRGVIGEEVFQEIYKLGLTDVRKYATDLALEAFTKKEKGARSMKVKS